MDMKVDNRSVYVMVVFRESDCHGFRPTEAEGFPLRVERTTAASKAHDRHTYAPEDTRQQEPRARTEREDTLQLEIRVVGAHF